MDCSCRCKLFQLIQTNAWIWTSCVFKWSWNQTKCICEWNLLLFQFPFKPVILNLKYDQSYVLQLQDQVYWVLKLYVHTLSAWSSELQECEKNYCLYNAQILSIEMFIWNPRIKTACVRENYSLYNFRIINPIGMYGKLIRFQNFQCSLYHSRSTCGATG